MSLIRKVLFTFILILILFDTSLVSWNRGFDSGYITAMSDIMLHIDTPDKFFKKLFDIKTLNKVQQDWEHEND